MSSRVRRLPYMENRTGILVTIVVNLLCAFVFQSFGGALTRGDVVADAVVCGAVTAVIDFVFLWRLMSRRNSAGLLPGEVPVSRLMQRLPRTFLPLLIFLVLFFAVLTGVLMCCFLFVFGIESMDFGRWLVFKLLYAAFLSAKVLEFVIFCLVQPDLNSAARGAVSCCGFDSQEVRNPLPKFSSFKEVYANITANIAMNVIVGSLLGGVVTNSDGSLLIYPSKASGMWLTGIIFGIITSVILTRAIFKNVRENLGDTTDEELAALAQLPAGNGLAELLPRRSFPLTIVVCVITAGVSAVLAPLIFWFFGIEQMNFYQFCLFITAYGMGVSKFLSRILLARCALTAMRARVRIEPDI